MCPNVNTSSEICLGYPLQYSQAGVPFLAEKTWRITMSYTQTQSSRLGPKHEFTNGATMQQRINVIESFQIYFNV